MDDRYVDVTALMARLAEARANDPIPPSPDEWLPRWRAAHPESEPDEVEDTAKPVSKRRERKPSVATLIKRAEKAGKTVTAITTDGVTLQLGEASPAKHNSWDDLETEKRQ